MSEKCTFWRVKSDQRGETCKLGGVKFSETFLKSFYRSKIVFHLKF